MRKLKLPGLPRFRVGDLIGWVPRRCQGCLEIKQGVIKRRMSTAYVNDASNFMVSCEDCYQASEEVWAEMWQEYWSGCL